MSSTSVKVKASSARSKAQNDVTMKSASALDGSKKEQMLKRADGDKAEQMSKEAGSEKVEQTTKKMDGDKVAPAKSNSPTADDAVKSKSSTFDSTIKKVQPYLDKHGHAIVYGIIGIIAAILILTIGFWPVLLLAIFAAIGIAIGKLHDSGVSMQSAAKMLTENLRRLGKVASR